LVKLPVYKVHKEKSNPKIVTKKKSTLFQPDIDVEEIDTTTTKKKEKDKSLVGKISYTYLDVLPVLDSGFTVNRSYIMLPC
jgi:hypothetical protein